MSNFNNILQRVEKPARYVGGEYNSIIKEWDFTQVRIAFAFPDVYEVGMSHLGLQILYHVVNSRVDALMERVFAPWIDMEREMRSAGVLLTTLESQRSVKEFDVIAFTLQYELSYTNVLNMLDLAGVPLISGQRTESDPLVIAGGPCAFNAEPLAPYLDAVFLGEGEQSIQDLIVLLKRKTANRQELLYALAQVPGVYVPSLYEASYDGRHFTGIQSKVTGVPSQITKRVVEDFETSPFPDNPIVPNMETVHDRAMLEIFRGCTRGCRFCQAGMIYRPVRERSVATLERQAAEILKNTGYEELALTSLSSSDYSGIGCLVTALTEKYKDQQINLSLPSLRVDAFSVDIAQAVQEVRKSGLTFAPEAGSQRLRDVINKQVTEADLLEAVTAAFCAGWFRVKLYFMLGLPTETEEDVVAIADLARKVVQSGLESGVPKGRLQVTVSTSFFVPKAHTPFQWEPQASRDVLQYRQRLLKDNLRGKNLVYRWHDLDSSFLEAVFARGDRRLAAVIKKAWELGCRMDGWHECFQNVLWQQAFREADVKPEYYANREFSYQDALPWGHLEPAINYDFLVNEHQLATKGVATADCRWDECPGCGVCDRLGVNPVRLEE